MQRHRHQEFIRFLNTIERVVLAGKVIHVILGNYAAYKHEKVRQWLVLVIHAGSSASRQHPALG